MSKPSEETPTEPDARDEPAVDPILQVLCEYAREHEDFEVGVTLWVPGGVVSGNVVGYKAWMTLIGQVPTVEGDNSFYSGLAQAALENYDEIVSTIDALPAANFINLKNARAFVGDQMLPNDGSMLWRGRLCEVAGWRFGLTSIS